MVITCKMESSQPQRVDCVVEEDSGSVFKKIISMDDFTKMILTATDDAEDSRISRLGTLPQGFIDGGMELGNMEAIMYVPPRKEIVNFFGTTYVVPFPALIFHFFVSNGKLTKSLVFATKVNSMEQLGNETPLFHYPFGNVYNDGKICWGNSVLPVINSLKQMDEYVSLFFSSGTNNDLFHSIETKSKGKPVKLDQRSLLELLQGKKSFPKTFLKSATRTLGNL